VFVCVQVKESTLNIISIVSDFTYAWHIIRDYIPLMHARIKQGLNAFHHDLPIL
jgi:hypothetical protein